MIKFIKNAIKKKLFYRFLYYSFAIHLPESTCIVGGRLSKHIRVSLCRHIFAFCGNNVNVERGARFGSGVGIRIGDNSGLGVNCMVPDGSFIGNNVMMGPNCYIHERNHGFSKVDVPMIQQGYTASKPVVIEDDVWIGRDVTIMIGRTIKQGTIIAANCVLTKDYPAYSIVGGNPSRLIKSRL